MDERTAGFVDAFRAFLDEVVHSERLAKKSDGPALIPTLKQHLGVDPQSLAVVTEDLPGHVFVNLDLAMAALCEQAGGGTLLGIGGGEQRRHSALSEILESSGRWGQFPLGTVDYVNLATSPDDTRQAVSFGLRLFTFDGAPVAVLQRGPDPRYGQPTAQLEVLTPVDGVAARLIAAVREEMKRLSVFRGQVLSLGGSDYEAAVGGVTFHRRPTLTPDDIVLPDGVLERVRRHIAGVAHHRDRLRAAGQHLKRGLLLHGPPGTGKTHTVRFLLGALPELTVVLLAGPSIAYVAEAAQMARALEPALVVLEDCDLVAENRDHYAGEQPLLFAVLEALDGLSDDADVAFLLTTNRVEVLEPALAQRPGRIDLAIEVPLPDEPARRQLIALYARSVPFSPGAIDEAAARSEGTTASFAKELVRRSVLIAAEDERDAGDGDLAAALDEMLSEAQAITRSLLGAGGPGPWGVPDDDYDGPDGFDAPPVFGGPPPFGSPAPFGGPPRFPRPGRIGGGSAQGGIIGPDGPYLDD
ncbi:AAA family ATPase [Cryptosporangium aurantiacum]|uniref:ATPase family associated with various cellular activities (AAA) n=1 Tax=Cryptosporangium aurantiacum TaxID=134849 RepID=A0A1M7TVZ6_9ACTN|nr:ATP-binding protein [Cryptosporangium aurantiacum]SHN74877.1 ATPase family associated with various cellular activities (AAA) [Cryptosporangium aurantiacum]